VGEALLRLVCLQATDAGGELATVQEAPQAGESARRLRQLENETNYEVLIS
jgi:hypothetical protein